MSYQKNITDLIKKIAKNSLPEEAASIVDGAGYLQVSETYDDVLLKLDARGLVAFNALSKNEHVSVRNHLFTFLDVVESLNGTEQPGESPEGVLNVDFTVPNTLSSVTKLKKIYRDQEVEKTVQEIRINQQQQYSAGFAAQGMMSPPAIDLKEPILRMRLTETLGQKEGKLALAELDKKLETLVTQRR